MIQIEDPETIALIRALSQRTRQDSTAVVSQAVREALARLASQPMPPTGSDDLRALAERLAARFHEPFRSIDHGDWLYDEHGLPR